MKTLTSATQFNFIFNTQNLRVKHNLLERELIFRYLNKRNYLIFLPFDKFLHMFRTGICQGTFLFIIPTGLKHMHMSL